MAFPISHASNNTGGIKHTPFTCRPCVFRAFFAGWASKPCQRNSSNSQRQHKIVYRLLGPR